MVENLLHVLVRLLPWKEIVAATVDKVSSTLRVLAFGHVVVTRCELAARIGIVLLLMLRVRRSTACRSHLDIRWHVAHHVLLIVVLLHRVHLAD